MNSKALSEEKTAEEILLEKERDIAFRSAVDGEIVLYTHTTGDEIIKAMHKYASQFKSKDNIPSLTKLRAAHSAGINRLPFDEWHERFNAMYPETDLNIPEPDRIAELEQTLLDYKEANAVLADDNIRVYKEWQTMESRLKAANEYLKRNGMPNF